MPHRYSLPGGIKYLAGGLLLFLLLAGIKTMSDTQAHGAADRNEPSASPSGQRSSPDAPGKKPEIATFGAGCFWCTEAVFLRLKGVEKVVSGYSGGHVNSPSYEQVCTGTTGHAEAVQVTYDPAQISYAELLEVFWKTHDPTTPNRQGNDVGPQYRSVIFYHDDQQRKLAEEYKRKLSASRAFHGRIVTEIVPYREFFPAENYHQDYFRLHGRQPYCQLVIRPKVEKLEKVFRDKLKSEGGRR